ncbi:MAG TPA: RluA family pseudouridine synthase [Saprospiraceae bacterium]|nr:RluA family pseudouridine synthase [Saprospiraceae bacterium]
MLIEELQEENTSEPLYEHHLISIDPGQTPVRIDKFLFDRYGQVSRNKIQIAIRAEAITVNDKPIKPNYKVRPGDLVSVLFPRLRLDEGIVSEDIPMDIMYEDDDVLIVNKPAGMVVHPGVGVHCGTLVNALAFHLIGDTLPVMPGNSEDRLGLVHRIDKETSGLLVVAKNEFAMTHLAKQFFKHEIDRKYLALVWGAPDPPEGTITGHIGRHLRDRLQMTVFPEGELGKHAITHYKTIEDMYYVSLVECTLETGRTHQIRVHMRYIGHPVFNDERYGGDRIIKGTVFTKYKQFVENCFKLMPRHALHAATLGFTHPGTGKKVTFESSLPDDFQSVLDKWRNYRKYVNES